LNQLTYTFEGREDADKYLRELSLLWAAWLVGLSGLVFTNPLVLVVWAVGIVGVLVVLSKPIQRRAERLVPEDKAEGGKLDTLYRGGTHRDRAIRDLAYGIEPLRAALRATGRSERWILLRYLIIGATIFAFIYSLTTLGL
jgi:hypothetical protein